MTEFDPVLRELQALAPARDRGIAMVTALRYINYKGQRAAGASAAQLAGIYPRAQAFERMFLAGV